MLEDFEELLGILGRLRELSGTETVIKNCSTSMRPKKRKMVVGERRLMTKPPSRLPKTPAEEPDIQPKDWRLAAEEPRVSFPASATMASLATSAMDAPRLLSRRKIVRVAMEISGMMAIDIHEIACKRAAARK